MKLYAKKHFRKKTIHETPGKKQLIPKQEKAKLVGLFGVHVLNFTFLF